MNNIVLQQIKVPTNHNISYINNNKNAHFHIYKSIEE